MESIPKSLFENFIAEKCNFNGTFLAVMRIENQEGENKADVKAHLI